MRLSLARVLSLFLVVAGATTLPVAAQLPASFADRDQPVLAKAATTSPTVVCAAKRGGAIRVPAATTCKGSERKVSVTVAKRTAWCLAKKGGVTDASTSKQAKACKRTRGKKVTVPSNTTLTLCARTDRAARWVKNSAKCRGTEKRRVFVNAAPTGLSATGLSVVDGAPVGTVAATLTARDSNVGDKLTFRLSAGGVDNAAFSISGRQLRVKTVPDLAAKSALSVKIEVRDLLGRSVTRTFTVHVTPVPHQGEIELTPSRIDENRPGGTPIGQLSVPNAGPGESFTFAVVSGPATIDGTELRSSRSYDHEVEPTVNVEISADNGVDPPLVETYAVTVDDVDEAPVVTADSYSGAIGNTPAVLGIAGTAPVVTLTGDLPLVNDTDPEGDDLSVVAASGVATTRGGAVNVDAQGRFSYRPALGARGGNDSFTIQVTDGTYTVPQTITIGLRDVAVWYVDVAGPVGGTGSAWAPLNTLSPLSTALDSDAPGDVIRVAAGAPALPTAGFALEADQQLIGAGAALVVDGVTLLPAAGVSTLAGSATGALVQLAQGSRVAGLTITPTGATAALSANNVNAATVESSATINGAGGRAVTITGGGGNLDVLAPISLPSWTAATPDAAVAVSGRTSGTVRFAAISTKIGQSSGGVSVTSAVAGSTVAFTGVIGLRTDTRPAFSASGGTIRWEADNTLITTTGTPLTLLDVVAAGTSAFTEISSAGAPSGIVATGVGGTGLRVTGGTIAGSTLDGVRLADLKSTIALQGLTINGSTGDGVHVEQGTGAGALTVSNSQFAGNLDDHIQVIARASGVLNPMQIQNNTLTGNTVGAWGQGIVVENDALFSGQLRYAVTGNTITGPAPSAAAAILVSGFNSGGVLSGTVANNQIGTSATPCGPLVDGIRIANDQGNMTAVARVADNAIVGCRTGIRLRAADGAAALHATVVNNTVSGRDPSADYGLSAEYGQLPTDSGASCLDVSGNTLAGGGGFPGLRVRKLHAFLGLPNYAGGTTDSVAVLNYLASRNPTTILIDVPASTTGNFGPSVCQTPS